MTDAQREMLRRRHALAANTAACKRFWSRREGQGETVAIEVAQDITVARQVLRGVILNLQKIRP